MIKPSYNIVDQEVKYSDLFTDIINSDKSFIKTRFTIEEGIDKKQFLADLEGELIWEFEENEDFTLDIKEDGDEYILMLSKKIYE
jgi:hypothetical protein